MEYRQDLELNIPFVQAVARVRAALAEQGFGVLTEIDIQATMRAKRGVEMEEYLILGACNPELSHRALEVDRTIGVFLPCTVVVRALGSGTSGISVLNPTIMSELTGLAELEPIATEASRRLNAVAAALIEADRPASH